MTLHSNKSNKAKKIIRSNSLEKMKGSSMVERSSLIWLLLYLLIKPITISCRRLPQHPVRVYVPPEIWLSEYEKLDTIMPDIAESEFREKVHFDNGFISKNGSDYFVEGQDIHSIVFNCQAPYPIKWTAPVPQVS